ncbi:hypothetical protein HMPREF7545_0204 [Selenomonas noxia ATCC 43541]|nr:hypothetical protein HMPREF7545_0204 [Selenomonas noxia ATCC 43541]
MRRCRTANKKQARPGMGHTCFKVNQCTLFPVRIVHGRAF